MVELDGPKSFVGNCPELSSNPESSSENIPRKSRVSKWCKKNFLEESNESESPKESLRSESELEEIFLKKPNEPHLSCVEESSIFAESFKVQESKVRVVTPKKEFRVAESSYKFEKDIISKKSLVESRDSIGVNKEEEVDCSMGKSSEFNEVKKFKKSKK